MPTNASDSDQIDRFKELARELGCNESEDEFDEALRLLIKNGPAAKHEPKKRPPKS